MPTCAGCDRRISDQYLLRVAPDLEWHAACLKCVDCGQSLDETCTCFVRGGKTYCRRDYIRSVRLLVHTKSNTTTFQITHLFQLYSCHYHLYPYRVIRCNCTIIQYIYSSLFRQPAAQAKKKINSIHLICSFIHVLVCSTILSFEL